MPRLTSRNLGRTRAAWARAVQARIDESGHSRSALADELGVSRQYLDKILDGGKPTIPVTTYRSICDQLELDPNKYAILRKDSPPWPSSK